MNRYRAIVAKIDSSLKAVSVSLGDFGILVDNVSYFLTPGLVSNNWPLEIPFVYIDYY